MKVVSLLFCPEITALMSLDPSHVVVRLDMRAKNSDYQITLPAISVRYSSSGTWVKADRFISALTS